MTCRPVVFRSQFLSRAESQYVVIELVMLAVTWAMMKCKMFLAGLQTFQVITDHNPLVSILNSHCLDEIENPPITASSTSADGQCSVVQRNKQ